MSNFETTGRIWMVCNVPTQQEKTHMSEQFDISANRIPHGLLEPAEREAIEAAAKINEIINAVNELRGAK